MTCSLDIAARVAIATKRRKPTSSHKNLSNHMDRFHWHPREMFQLHFQTQTLSFLHQQLNTEIFIPSLMPCTSVVMETLRLTLISPHRILEDTDNLHRWVRVDVVNVYATPAFLLFDPAGLCVM